MYFNTLQILMALIFLFGLSQSRPTSFQPQKAAKVSKTIYVGSSGKSDFTTVQQAINSIPSNNKEWIRIKLSAGTYDEKVEVTADKTFILLEGDKSDNTIIQWDDVGSDYKRATFAVLAENFVARNIQFRNRYDTPPPNFYYHWAQGPFAWSTAVHVGADKAAFYNCKFIGQEDTLNDHMGRHYFESCYIEGFVDFIWGFGTSIYQNCSIFINQKIVKTGVPGYIVAQGRMSASETSGFVFNHGSVSGNGIGYLGRAYKPYSRVLFHKTHMSNIVVPQGWDAWHSQGNEGTIDFGEDGCTGAGSNKSKRVKWLKKFSPKEVKFLTNPATFINQDGWLQAIPA